MLLKSFFTGTTIPFNNDMLLHNGFAKSILNYWSNDSGY